MHARTHTHTHACTHAHKHARASAPQCDDLVGTDRENHDESHGAPFHKYIFCYSLSVLRPSASEGGSHEGDAECAWVPERKPERLAGN